MSWIRILAWLEVWDRGDCSNPAGGHAQLYREARRLLVEELGLEPSTPLRYSSRPPSLLPMRKAATEHAK
jgi:isopentenyldiphosphate isomerase